jgi:hypothetical protein
VIPLDDEQEAYCSAQQGSSPAQQAAQNDS